MNYKAIIFDFNGVLFFDADLQANSWQGVAKELRGTEMTDDELDTHMHGRPNSYVLSYLAGRTIAGQELLELIQAKESIYRDLCLQNPHRFVLSPGAHDLLDTLTDNHIPRTIATSSEITNVQFFIQHLQLHRWFDVSKIVYDNGVRPGKPAPDMYLAAAQNIGTAAGECMVVEDAVSGIQAAHAAGIGYIIGLGAPAAHAKLRACAGLSTVIESLEQFPRNKLPGALDSHD
jgi:beta-phosphoglucomutase-like phosphatase (HAD superfamily)